MNTRGIENLTLTCEAIRARAYSQMRDLTAEERTEIEKIRSEIAAAQLSCMADVIMTRSNG